MRARNGETGAPLIVLMFHGLVDHLPSYATFAETRTCQLRVSDFAGIVESCARRYRFVRLADISRYLNGEATEIGVLVTFDDGLSSTCELGVPILLRYGVTATLFVTTGWIDAGVSPPIFALEQELWARIPVRLGVQAHDFSYEADVRSHGSSGTEIARLWSALFAHGCAPLALRKENFCFDGRPWSESVAEGHEGLWRPATWDALRSAVRSGALEIGAHGATHAPWTWLSASALDDELASVRARLEAEFDRPVETCAYPHGISDPETRENASAVFKWAFGTGPRLAAPGVDPANLPRFHVPSERPNGLFSVVSWPLVGRALRKGTGLLGL